MNDAERFEALERWLEKIEEFPGPVIIEGQRDIAALARFCELQLVSLNSGNSVLQTVEALARGEEVDRKVYIPFQLVTPENMSDFTTQN